MTEQGNVPLVHAHLAAFARGDFAGALAAVADDVDRRSPATDTRHDLVPSCFSNPPV